MEIILWCGKSPTDGVWATGPRLEKIEIPPALVNTAYYFHVADIMSKVSFVLGKQQESDHFNQLKAKIKARFNSRFFDRENKRYWEGWQGANVFPLAFGLVPEDQADDVFQSLVNHIISNNEHLDTGILGTPLLLDVLTKYGRADLAFDIMDQRDFPGYGHYILGQRGNNTLGKLEWQKFSRSSHVWQCHSVVLPGPGRYQS